jgi:hypothetical protein
MEWLFCRFGRGIAFPGVEEVGVGGVAAEDANGVGGGEAGAEEAAVGRGHLFVGLQPGFAGLGAVLAAEEVFDEGGFILVLINLGDGSLGEVGGDAALAEVAEDTGFAESLVLEAGSGVGFCEAGVVEITVFLQTGEDGVDVGGSLSAWQEGGAKFSDR